MCANISNISLDGKLNNLPIFLAPMSGITDKPTRTMIQKFETGVVFSEMLASKELLSNTNDPKILNKLGIDDLTGATGVQLAGCDPRIMGETTRFLESQGVKLIDINMGCPAKRVVGGFAGSALMKDVVKAAKIIESVVKVTTLPVTLKMRLGWDDNSLNAKDLAKIAEDLGIKLITVHARTRSQFYKGQANWGALSEIKNNISVPLIVNGDISSFKSAKLALERSNADGFMIGRAVLGKPWLLSQLAFRFGLTRKRQSLSSDWFLDYVSEHYERLLSFYGLKRGVLCSRKHLRWYFVRILSESTLLKELLVENDPNLVLKKINFSSELKTSCAKFFSKYGFDELDLEV